MGSKKRKAELEIPIADENEESFLRITPLGAGNEVGRSCIVMEYKGKTVMLDAGIHPAYNGLAGLPFYDEVDPTSVDVLLITHFHLDHAASLPYFMEKTMFKGRVFMTHPTKAIYKWMLSDYVRVSTLSVEEQLYTEQDLLSSWEKIEAVDYHEEIEVDGIRFTAYNAGHVLGAAMFLIEIAGVKVLYTGDYSREEDRHLMAAEKPSVQPDVLITESTYGVQSHEPRLEKEARLTGLVRDIVQRGGRCLMPVFALGRAQELLLILDEYWEAHQELEPIPIYYASSLAKKCMAVYQTYINMMNTRIQKQFAVSNPFVFKHISNLKNMDHFDDTGPCVMIASPGMLQSGLSRELFERWAPNKKNGLIIPGYCVEGTLARDVLNEPSEFTSLTGAKIPLRCSVDYISFSAHVDYTQNSQFIAEVRAPHVILVHGEANTMHRLRNALQSKFAESEDPTKIYTPKNCETVRLHFRGEKMARTVGGLAARYPVEGQLLEGVLVSKDYRFSVLKAEELPEFTSGLQTAVMVQRQRIWYTGGWPLLRYHLEQMFGAVDENFKGFDGDAVKEKEGKMAKRRMRVFETVAIEEANKNELILEWEGNSMNDMVADSVVAVVLSIESSPASVKLTTKPCSHEHDHVKDEVEEELKGEVEVKEKKEEHVEEAAPVYDGDDKSEEESVDDDNIDKEASELKDEGEDKKGQGAEDEEEAERDEEEQNVREVMEDMARFFEQQFGQVEVDQATSTIRILVDGQEARVDCRKFKVECEYDILRGRATNVMQRVRMIKRSLSRDQLVECS
ncbi:uncharacterized protein VTP21DRAFT_8895 [Calcarisporiella thermophila]|uniref:uncharacterized protein n=1 Tax=Calcarisporiella thermophila TaxID=911321 RepID=UPI0037434F16